MEIEDLGQLASYSFLGGVRALSFPYSLYLYVVVVVFFFFLHKTNSMRIIRATDGLEIGFILVVKCTRMYNFIYCTTIGQRSGSM